MGLFIEKTLQPEDLLCPKSSPSKSSKLIWYRPQSFLLLWSIALYSSLACVLEFPLQPHKYLECTIYDPKFMEVSLVILTIKSYQQPETLLQRLLQTLDLLQSKSQTSLPASVLSYPSIIVISSLLPLFLFPLWRTYLPSHRKVQAQQVER